MMTKSLAPQDWPTSAAYLRAKLPRLPSTLVTTQGASHDAHNDTRRDPDQSFSKILTHLLLRILMHAEFGLRILRIQCGAQHG